MKENVRVKMMLKVNMNVRGEGEGGREGEEKGYG